MELNLENARRIKTLGEFLLYISGDEGLVRGKVYGIRENSHHVLILPLKKEDSCVVCSRRISVGDGAEVRLISNREMRERRAGKHISFHYSHFERSGQDL